MLANSGFFEACRWGVDVVIENVCRVVVFPGGPVQSRLVPTPMRLRYRSVTAFVYTGLMRSVWLTEKKVVRQ